MARINLRQFGSAYTIATVTSVTTAAAGVWLANGLGYDFAYDSAIVGTWFATTGLPSTMYAGQQLYKVLGHRPPATATASTRRGKSAGRPIPIHGGESGFVFLTALNSVFNNSPSAPPTPRTPPPPLPDVFTVHDVTWAAGMDPVTVEFSEIEVRRWLDAVWKRQTSDEANHRRYPMSRRYFTERWRPQLDFSEYYGLVSLCEISGLVVNRAMGKSGRLLLQPSRAIRQIKWTFA